MPILPTKVIDSTPSDLDLKDDCDLAERGNKCDGIIPRNEALSRSTSSRRGNNGMESCMVVRIEVRDSGVGIQSRDLEDNNLFS